MRWMIKTINVSQISDGLGHFERNKLFNIGIISLISL